MSPFSGASDDETADNIRRCDLKFPSEHFSGISDNAHDFVRKLVVKSKAGRLNVFEALEHPWLLEANVDDNRIPNSKYDALKAKLKGKYAGWPDPSVPIGRTAHLSSLRRLQPKPYGIYSSYFDRREAAPRFIVKPRNQHVIEGQSAEFKAVILAASPPIVSWYKDNAEIKQSCKHMKKYKNNSYALEIKRCTLNDGGEYIVKASNTYGDREYVAFLTVEGKNF